MQKTAIPSWKVPAIAGYMVITSTFVVLGGWSAVARLDSAITAQGVVSAETNRKTVQHLEGGIVKEIRIREGQHVDAGQVLFRLIATQPKAGYELQRNQLELPGCAGSPLDRGARRQGRNLVPEGAPGPKR